MEISLTKAKVKFKCIVLNSKVHGIYLVFFATGLYQSLIIQP